MASERSCGQLEPEEIIRLERERVVMLDQRRLPADVVELECDSAAAVARAIRALAIRGAPAIGVAGAMGVALAAALGDDLDEAEALLARARPTAVNLAWAVRKARRAGDDPLAIAAAARRIHRDEVGRCRSMSKHAVPLLEEASGVLTHCNTGALATGGHGTALGAVRTAFDLGLVDHVYVGETRPLLQGSRLTAWELDRAGIPYTVIVDSAAAAVMASGRVSHVLVGADRIAANGDTANKIGTYGLALAARRHGLEFIVVAPTSTVDLATATGDEIVLEERDPAEVSDRFAALNLAFDVTPAGLIDAIVTERGPHVAPYGPALADAGDAGDWSAPRERESSDGARRG